MGTSNNKPGKLNDFVIRFANVNGSGSASANHMFAKSIFRMGVPVSPHNIFPSNIQGLPTWYEVRVNDQGYLGRRDGGVDLMVAMNAQSFEQDMQNVVSGGYLLFDSSKALPEHLLRDDIETIGIPITDICIREFYNPQQRQLFKNIVYVGALSALLNIDFSVLKDLVSDQFKGKQKLIAPNVHALELGHQYASENYACPLNIHVSHSNKVDKKILIDGNTALGLGCIYGGATIAAWYPITPSTSVVDNFKKYCQRLRIDAGTGKQKYAIVQAEDELAAMGMVIGAGWNGARSFTATSGPGVSLMSEFLGLAYFAEVPVVLFNIQRAGPSTGMPTRTQQADILSCAYASHGDTKHVLLFPCNPNECFEFAAEAFNIAERLQCPVIVMSDLDLGMNDHLSDPLQWDDQHKYDRGKVLDKEALESLETFGRYVDDEGDGICYRTYPGTHASKGAYFTRGSSHDPFAAYTENGTIYRDGMDRLTRKFLTALNYIPQPIVSSDNPSNNYGLIFYGTTENAMDEALDVLHLQGLALDALRIRAFPFHQSVTDFIEQHDAVFVVEQNRDRQMRNLIINECDIDGRLLHSVLTYDGLQISAQQICTQILAQIDLISDPRGTGANANTKAA